MKTLWIVLAGIFVSACLPCGAQEPGLALKAIYGLNPSSGPVTPFNQTPQIAFTGPSFAARIYNHAEETAKSLHVYDGRWRDQLISEDDQRVYTIETGAVAEWSAADGNLLRRVATGEDSLVNGAVLTEGDSYLAILYGSKLVVVDVGSFTVARSATFPGYASTVAVDSVQRRVYFNDLGTSAIRSLDLDTGIIAAESLTPTGLGVRVLTHTGGRLLCLSATRTIFEAPEGASQPRIWQDDFYLESMLEPELVWSLTVSRPISNEASPPSPGNFDGILSSNGAKALLYYNRVFDTATGAESRLPFNAATARFNRDGSRLAVSQNALGGSWQLTRVYDTTGDAELLKTIPSRSARFGLPSGDAGNLLMGIEGAAPEILDKDDNVVATLQCTDPGGTCADIHEVIVIPHRNLFASNESGSITIWSGETGEMLNRFVPSGGVYSIDSLRASRDGSNLMFVQWMSGGYAIRCYSIDSIVEGNPVALATIPPPPGRTNWYRVAPGADATTAYGVTRDQDGAIVHRIALPGGTLTGSASISLPQGYQTLYDMWAESDPTGDRFDVITYGYRFVFGFFVNFSEHIVYDAGSMAVRSRVDVVPGPLFFSSDAGFMAAGGKLIDTRTNEQAVVWEGGALAISENDGEIYSGSGGHIVRWSLDIPELNVIHAREAVLTSSGEVKWDRNGDGVLDAADFVIVLE